MSSAQMAFEDIERTREIAKRLEQRVSSRMEVKAARAYVARAAGASPGTLESLRKGRLKRLEGWLRDRIWSLLMQEIGAEIQRQKHDLELYSQSGGDPRHSDLAQIKADLAALEALLPGASEMGGAS